MRNLMEKQLSWLALFATAFYSLLASCRSEECGHEKLARCARPLERISGNDLSFVTKKEDLQQLCSDLEAGTECIRKYTLQCMKEKQREHFSSLYAGTNKAIMELCQDGPYQDEFLKHAPCMQKVMPEYEICYKKHLRATQEIERANTMTEQNGSIKSVCCAFQEYLECSHHPVRRQCGEAAAQFTKEFLDRMSSSLIKMHCTPYTSEVCTSYSSGSTFRTEMLIPVVLILLGRYFT